MPTLDNGGGLIVFLIIIPVLLWRTWGAPVVEEDDH